MSVWSVFSALPFGLPFVYDALLAGLYANVTAQFVMQGLGTGIVAVLLLGITIRNVGASEASAIVAIAPVLSVVLAIPLLGEVPEWQAAVGAIAITCGAVLANWRAPRPAHRQ